jgi:hypothetical protein
MRQFRIAAFALTVALGAAPATAPQNAHAQVAIGVSVGVAPPPLPIYDQPPIPAPGYLWTPGYWAWDGDDYYWVPGTWVLPPEPGLLWTPAWWGWDDGAFLFHVGYWGPVVGFYGGVDYGFGYFGDGYAGGYWDHDRFFYNRPFNNLGRARYANVYSRPAFDPRRNVSYNGGAGGVAARPTAAQLVAAHERRAGPTALQSQHQRLAATAPMLHASANHGRPPVGATVRPGAFRAAGLKTGPAAMAQLRGGRSGAHDAGGPNNAAMTRLGSQNAAAARAEGRNAAAITRGGTAHGPAEAPSAARFGTPASASVGRNLTERQTRRTAPAIHERAPFAADRGSRTGPGMQRFAARGGPSGFERAMPPAAPRGGRGGLVRNAGPAPQPHVGGGGRPGGGGRGERPPR